MRFRKQREAEQREEDMLYDQLWKRDYASRIAREEAERRKLQELNATRLNKQADMREKQRQADTQAERDEKRLMTETWTKQKQEADELDH